MPGGRVTTPSAFRRIRIWPEASVNMRPGPVAIHITVAHVAGCRWTTSYPSEPTPVVEGDVLVTLVTEHFGRCGYTNEYERWSDPLCCDDPACESRRPPQ